MAKGRRDIAPKNAQKVKERSQHKVGSLPIYFVFPRLDHPDRA